MTLPAEPLRASQNARSAADEPRPAGVRSAPIISLRDLRAHCMSCSLRDLCVPLGLDAEGLRKVDALITARQKLRKGESAFRAGDAFHSLYAVRVGSLKTMMLAEDGREQVAGYHILGDIVGMDGIGMHKHAVQAVALEDTEVCALPFERLEELARAVPQLQTNLHRFLSREISRDQGVMLLLGSMRAEERLATFLLGLAERYRARGYSSTQFVLRMTREEIGSYLGLKLETVSRLFSRFRADGIIDVSGRAVKLADVAALKALTGRH